MHTLLAVAALSIGSPRIENGALIYLERSNAIVEQYTGSNVSHVAIAINIGQQPWIYEATPAKVRRVPLEEYYAEIKRLNQGRGRKIRMYVMAPREKFTWREIRAMKTYLDGQLGRRYSVKGYVRNRPASGIHCAELIADTLAYSGRIKFAETHRLSPGVLVTKVSVTYEAGTRTEIRVSKPVLPETWCDRQWTTWFAFSAWCRWACGEAWRFCR